jgi:hypothetical protein
MVFLVIGLAKVAKFQGEILVPVEVNDYYAWPLSTVESFKSNLSCATALPGLAAARLGKACAHAPRCSLNEQVTLVIVQHH